MGSFVGGKGVSSVWFGLVLIRSEHPFQGLLFCCCWVLLLSLLLLFKSECKDKLSTDRGK